MNIRRTLLATTIFLISAVAGHAGIEKRIVPIFVRELAAKAFVEVPKDRRQESEDDFCVRFAFGFLEGFTSPDGDGFRRDPDGGIRRGYTAGQSYRRAFPEKLEFVFSEFGYVQVECDGLATVGHFESTFEPLGSKHSGPWQLENLGATWPEVEGGRFSRTKIRAKGFLSPEYDDIGPHKRRFQVTSMERSKG